MHTLLYIVMGLHVDCIETRARVTSPNKQKNAIQSESSEATDYTIVSAPSHSSFLLQYACCVATLCDSPVVRMYAIDVQCAINLVSNRLFACEQMGKLAAERTVKFVHNMR